LDFLLNDPSPVGGATALALVLALTLVALGVGAWIVVRMGNPN
jgi:hypothetical protein